MREVIKKSDELIEVGGKEYPLWEIIREGGKLYCREVAIMAEIDGMKIPATLESDDWMRAGGRACTSSCSSARWGSSGGRWRGVMAAARVLSSGWRQGGGPGQRQDDPRAVRDLSLQPR